MLGFPMPDSSRILGLLIAPADTITSPPDFREATYRVELTKYSTCDAATREPDVPVMILLAKALVMSFKFEREATGW